MTYPFHNVAKLDGYDHKDDQFTVLLAAGTDTTFNTIAGPIPVTWDASAANQMKVAGDADPIHGVLLQVENRVIDGLLLGTVTLEYNEVLQIKAGLAGGQVVAVGSVLCGAAGGFVRTAVSGVDASYHPYGPRCVEVRNTTGAVAIRT